MDVDFDDEVQERIETSELRSYKSRVKALAAENIGLRHQVIEAIVMVEKLTALTDKLLPRIRQGDQLAASIDVLKQKSIAVKQLAPQINAMYSKLGMDQRGNSKDGAMLAEVIRGEIWPQMKAYIDECMKNTKTRGKR